MQFEDLIYETRNGVAWIIINRPEKLNCEGLCERSPTAIAIAKRSFNMDTAHQAGIAGMGMYAFFSAIRKVSRGGRGIIEAAAQLRGGRAVACQGG